MVFISKYFPVRQTNYETQFSYISYRNYKQTILYVVFPKLSVFTGSRYLLLNGKRYVIDNR